MDLFVANDTMPNFLFLNKGAGKFEEIGLAAGVAYGEAEGRAQEWGWMPLITMATVGKIFSSRISIRSFSVCITTRKS